MSKLGVKDQNLGTISKDACHKLYAKASLVISIPISDSSPRSVYEAIFCGAAVATVYSPWIDNLPTSMRERIVVLDPLDERWFCEAIAFAEKIMGSRFEPCSDALERFDQFNVTIVRLCCMKSNLLSMLMGLETESAAHNINALVDKLGLEF